MGHAGLLIHKKTVALAEGTAAAVLAAQSDGKAFHQKGRKGECFGIGAYWCEPSSSDLMEKRRVSTEAQWQHPDPSCRLARVVLMRWFRSQTIRSFERLGRS